MSCGKRHGTPILNIQNVANLEECMDQCAANSACSSVDFDQGRKICYLSNNDGPPTIDASIFASAHSVGCSGACEGCGKRRGGSVPNQQPANPNTCSNHNQVVDVNNYPFRVKCQTCYMSDPSLAALKPEATTWEECMELYILDQDNFASANWYNGGCILKVASSAAGEGLQPSDQCAAAFVPLWK